MISMSMRDNSVICPYPYLYINAIFYYLGSLLESLGFIGFLIYPRFVRKYDDYGNLQNDTMISLYFIFMSIFWNSGFALT